MKDQIAIVLVETTHDGNVGATARAMKNMGFSDLRLVNPKQVPGEEALARASGADEILHRAKIHVSLDQALSDCHFVLGTSARMRDSKWRVYDPEQCAVEITLRSGDPACKSAIVFGRESSGLTNAELDLCDALVTIPVNPEFSSLNVASAVMVLCYSLSSQINAEKTPQVGREHLPATSEEREALFKHLERLLLASGFMRPAKSTKLIRKIRHLYVKASPDSEEVAILRGVLSEFESILEKSNQ